jgi:hypothetical protein
LSLTVTTSSTEPNTALFINDMRFVGASP